MYLQISYKGQKTILLDTSIFLVTDLTSYTKIISPLVFFVFVTTFYIGFTQIEKC